VWRAAFLEFCFAHLDASGLQGIDEVEHLPLPAYELGACLSAAAIVIGGCDRRSESSHALNP
jgi:hypothetical protein